MYQTTTYAEYWNPVYWRKIEKQCDYERNIVRDHRHLRPGPKERKYQNKKRNVMSNIH